MAGKHNGTVTDGNPGVEAIMVVNKPNYPGSIVDRAYREGREGRANPHAAGTPARISHSTGTTYITQASGKVQTNIA